MNNLSFWEIESYIGKPDFVVAGAGIVGLSTALNLRRYFRRSSILVLERGVFPSGASTKNAGFACYGSLSELASDLENHSLDEVLSLVEKRWKGLLRLRENLGDKNIDFRKKGGYEVFRSGDVSYDKAKKVFDEFNKHVGKITGIRNVYKVADNKLKSFGLKGFDHLIENTGEGQLDSGKMMKMLEMKARASGIRIINGVQIESYNEVPGAVMLHVNGGPPIRTKKLLITINGFAKHLIPGADVIPARAQVMITSVLSNLKLRGSFHFEDGFYYFRDVGNRVLIGGGRNLDLSSEQTDEFGITTRIQERLEMILKENILHGKKFSIENRWSGIMGLGTRKSTIIKKLSARVYCGVRMGGMGVAIGSLVGEELAQLIRKNA